MISNRSVSFSSLHNDVLLLYYLDRSVAFVDVSCVCLGGYVVCVCVRERERERERKFIRGDVSISWGVQKAEPEVRGQGEGIRQLSLTIKTYCVAACVWVGVSVCVRH